MVWLYDLMGWKKDLVFQPWVLAGGNGAPGPSIGGLSHCGRSARAALDAAQAGGNGETNRVGKCDQ